MGFLRNLWRQLFRSHSEEPDAPPARPRNVWEVEGIIRDHRPDLLEEYYERMSGGACEFGEFLDREFPLHGERWGRLGVGEIPRVLRAYLGLRRPSEVDDYFREQLAAVAKARFG